MSESHSVERIDANLNHFVRNILNINMCDLGKSLFVNFWKVIESALHSPVDAERRKELHQVYSTYKVINPQIGEWKRENTALILLCDLGGEMKHVG